MKSNRQILKLLLAAILLQTTACNNDSNSDSNNSATEVDTGIKLNTKDEIFDSWDDFYSKEDVTFSIDSFSKQDTLKGELYTRAFTPNESYFKNYGKLLTYNSDSSMFIDAYSLAWMIETKEDGKQYARGGEVDHEVAVIDIKKKTRTRLLFCGPSCHIQRAFWYNENIVGIMGLSSEYADEYYTPVIWFVNINNGITIPFEYNESISIIQANEYDERYLKSKGINLAY